MNDNTDPNNTAEFGKEAAPKNAAETFGAFTASLCLIFAAVAFNAWVYMVMWNWFGVVFIDHPITIKEAAAAALLVWTTRRTDAKPDGDKAWDRFKKMIVLRLFLLGVSWVVHMVMF